MFNLLVIFICLFVTVSAKVALTCPPHEEVDECAAAICRRQRCSQIGHLIMCPQVIHCSPGCVCKEGYLRTHNWTCVPVDQCDHGICPQNEVPHACAGSLCVDEHCKGISDPAHCLSIINDCDAGCVCKRGYLRKADGVCVPKEQCDPVKTCPLNEILDPCGSRGCPHRKCKDMGKPLVCDTAKPCEEACVCRPGWLRLDNDTCVHREHCDFGIDCSPTELENFCTNALCEVQRCKDIGVTMMDCPMVSECVPGCICKEQHLRNEEGICVRVDQCDHSVCPQNETPEGCVNALCRKQTCGELNLPKVCSHVTTCEAGCACKISYLRAHNGTCVPVEECDPRVCPPNEVPEVCSNAFCDQNCRDIGKSITCDVRVCRPGCVCKFGYLRTNEGSCIPKEECNMII